MTNNKNLFVERVNVQDDSIITANICNQARVCQYAMIRIDRQYTRKCIHLLCVWVESHRFLGKKTVERYSGKFISIKTNECD